MKEIVLKAKKHIKNGFLHVFGAGTVNKIVSLCNSLFIIRVLSQDDYGMYGYVINIVNMFMLFNGLGTLTGLLQYGSMAESRDKRNGFFYYGVRVGLITNLLSSCLIIIYAVAIPQKIEGATIFLIIAALIPLFRYINDSIPIYLRTENENKKYGVLVTTNSVLLLVIMLVFAHYFGVLGAIVSRYLVNLFTIVAGLFMCLNFTKIFTKKAYSVLSQKEKRDFFKYSIITCFNNAVSQLLYNIDVFVIGIVIGTTKSIASYKVATIIPFGLSFISTSVITYFYPIFVKHREDKKWLSSNYKKLLLLLGVVNGGIAVFCFGLAPIIVMTVFGTEYADAVTCFRILIIGYWISSTFRISSGNVLDMLLKVKTNFAISIIAGVANIVLDVLLIIRWGSVGAAIATCSIFVLTSVMSNAGVVLYLKTMPERIEGNE
ncbi:MAG: oligosaccharide flippase family protein [Lachnospiraceae bacterium]|nr:oligosaccharide flippase family protein [Lachnospiraceae bacterium]